MWIGAKVKVEINKKMENESEWESGMSEITWACSNRGNKENKLGQSKAKHFHRRACQLLRVLLEANLPKQTNLYSGFISEYQKYICQYKQTRNYGSIFEYEEKSLEYLPNKCIFLLNFLIEKNTFRYFAGNRITFCF